MQRLYTKNNFTTYIIIATCLTNILFWNAKATDFAFPETDSVLLRTITTTTAASLDLKINEISASNISILSDEKGDYDDWFELYNFGDDTINLNGLFISDKRNDIEKFQIVEDTFIAPQSFVIIWADGEPEEGILHTNFKLSNQGEAIYISNTSLAVLDSVNFASPIADVTYGRLQGNFLSWNYFATATPGTQNPEAGMIDVLTPPTSDKLAGYYDSTFQIALLHPDTSITIKYTLDGKTPIASSASYTNKIKISNSTILRYRTFKEGYIPSNTQTQTFFIGDTKELDAISIVANPKDLTGSQGILSTRRNDVEKPISIEYFGNDHNLKFKIDGGVQLHSPKSNPQLSLRLYARSDYGNKTINYQIFPDKDIHTFKRLILRNSGNDGTVLNTPSVTHFRDGLHQTLFQEIGHKPESSAYKAVNLFINGDYYGIYNMRERVDEYFIESNFGYTGDMDLLERAFNFPGNRNPIFGSFDLFRSMELYIKNNDLSIDSIYNNVDSLYDLNQFTDYWIHEIFIGNLDWMSNNIKIYRPNSDGAKFKWILWDTDHGSGLPYSSYGTPSWNTVNWSLSIGQLRTENGSNNIIHRGLVTNKNYKNRFINRYADLLNTTYSTKQMHNTIDSLSGLLKNDMTYHAIRWNLEYTKWINALTYIKSYYQERPHYVREDIRETFSLKKYHNVILKSNAQEQGTIKVNTISPLFANNEWSGIYYEGVPITITALPKRGYHFTHWGDSLGNNTPQIIADIFSDTTYMAHFEVDSIDPNQIDSTKIMISEVNIYEEDGAVNWLELVNKCGTSIPLKGWRLKTATHTIYLPDIYIEDNEYIVLYDDETKDTLGYKVEDLELSGELLQIELFNSNNKLVDSIKFSTKESEFPLSRNYYFTLELTDLELDNSIPDNWRSSFFIGGSPTATNSTPTNNLLNVKINEILASNDTIIKDDYEEYEDYIELYNKGAVPLDIRGLLISDEKKNPAKYQIPNTKEPIVILPNGYLLLWADDDQQGPLHTNFKLGKSGEKFALFQNNGVELIKTDELEFGNQLENISYGAIYNGINTGKNSWNYQYPTPGYSNEQIIVKTIDIKQDNSNESRKIDALLFPVPVTDKLYVRVNKNTVLLEVEVYNILGKQQAITYEKISGTTILIHTESLTDGIYLLKIKDKNSNMTTKRFIK